MSPATTPEARERIEHYESEYLRSDAARSAEATRQTPESPHPYRTAFQRDRDRILHSKAFRRLKGKTQVFLAPSGDHYRTRLTHTLEVSQISRTVTRALALNEDLAEAIALAHDLGHTPFGHAGETVLRELLEGGFKHYEHSVRVVDILESTPVRTGLNLTDDVRDGILHHSMGKVVLLGREGPTARTLEGQIVSVCDAIAYINHDIDDAIRAGVIELNDFPQSAVRRLGERTSERIETMVSALISGSEQGPVRMEEEVREATVELRAFLYERVYPCDAIVREMDKAQKILRELHEYFMQHPADFVADSPAGDSLDRRVADAVASMTDRYALELFERLFFPGP